MRFRQHTHKIVLALAIVTLAGVTSVFQHASAATGQLYLTTTASSVLNGDQIGVSLRINPGTNVDTVNASIGYDAGKLQLVSIDCSGSPFAAFPSCPTSGNPISITGADLGSSVTVDSFVAKVTFKALVGSGSSAVTLSGDAAYAAASTGPSVAGTTVNFTSPPPTCPAGQTGTPPNCTTPPSGGGTGSGTGGGSAGGGSNTGGTSSGSGSSSSGTKAPTTTPATPPATTGPAAIQVTDQKVQYTTASIAITSTAPTQVFIQYGLSKDSMNSQTAPSDFATTHQVALDPSLIAPGKTYYYIVISKDQQGNTTQTEPAKFDTKGLQLSVGVFDKDHKPLAHKAVTLHSTATTATTNDKGVAIFSNVDPGTHHVSYVDGKKTYSQPVQVANNIKTADDGTQTAEIQNVSVVLPLQPSNLVQSALWPAVVLLVVLVAVVILYVKRDSLHPGAGGGKGGLLVTQPVVVGGKDSPAAPSSQIQVQSSSNTAAVLASRLDSIPEPSKPSPGSTFTPHDGTGGVA